MVLLLEFTVDVYRTHQIEYEPVDFECEEQKIFLILKIFERRSHASQASLALATWPRMALDF